MHLLLLECIYHYTTFEPSGHTKTGEIASRVYGKRMNTETE